MNCAPTHTITVRRLVQANRTRVFNAFGNADALTEWFTPDPGVSLEVLDFDFVPGGTFRLRFIMPDGTRPTVGGQYLVIDQPDQIVFLWVWEVPDIHAGIQTQVSVRFILHGDQTEVVITHDRLPSREACERHDLGWQGALNRLGDTLDKRAIHA